MIYNEITRRYFDAAPNVGSLPGSEIGRGGAGDREQGTRVQFDVRVADGQIQAARFLAFGCPHTIAVCAFVASVAEGTAAQRALPESPAALMRRFAMPAEKRSRLLIIEDAGHVAQLEAPQVVAAAWRERFGA